MSNGGWTERTGAGRVWRELACARVAVSWALAGGVIAGGFLLLSVALAGTASSSAAPGAVGVLFVLGALAGLVHGGMLGYLGRELSGTRREALTSLLVGGVTALLLAPVAWFVALHLALTAPFWARGFLPRLGVSLSWLVGLTLCLWAAWEGWRASSRAFRRWPERRVGSLILAGVLAFLATRFVLERPPSGAPTSRSGAWGP